MNARNGRSAARGQRGQLVLTTALVLAIVFVGVALTLNTVLVMENRATRTTDETNVVQAHQTETDARVGGAVRYANLHNYGSAAALDANLSAAVEAFDRNLAMDGSLRGESVRTTAEAVHVGRRIVQDDPRRNFTAGGDITAQSDWTLTENVTETVWFRQTIQTHSLVAATASTTLATLARTAYSVDVVDADGDRWSVYLFRGAASNNVYTLVERPHQDFANNSTAALDAWDDQRCQRQNDTVAIDYVGATVDGEACEPLGFFAGTPPSGWALVDAPYTIQYRNTRADTALYTGDTVRGGYRLLVDQAAVPSPTPYDAADSGRSPRAPPAIYAVDMRFDYRTSVISYTSRWRSRPRDPGRFVIGGSPPTVSSLSVTDGSSLAGGAQFDVDWTVEDGDGDLDEVAVYLYDNSTGDVVDVARTDVSGAGTTASGTLSVGDSLDVLGEEYRLVVEVTDTAANADTDETTQAADGDDST